MKYRPSNLKSLPRVREQKCRDCKQPIVFRYFTRLDSNKKPVKSWRCAFDNSESKYKHRCKQGPASVPAAVSQEKEKEIAA
jgi:hypothetical protein